MSGVKVRDRMHTGVFVCRPDTPVTDVVQVMAGRDISALVVVDDSGHAVGVISRTDLTSLTSASPGRRPWKGLRVRQLMSSPVISVPADAPLDEAVGLMREHQIHRVVVTERDGGRDRPVGILSQTDLVREPPAGS